MRAYGVGTAAVLTGGRVLIAGGYSSVGTPTCAIAFLFNPASSNFSPLGSTFLGNTYAPATASLPGGRALVAGG